MKSECEVNPQHPAGRQTILYEVLRSAVEHLDPEAVAEAAVEAIARLTDWSSVCLIVPDEAGTHFVVQAAAGPASAGGVETFSPGQGIVGRAFQTAQIQYVGEANADPNGEVGRAGTRSELAVPLQRGGRVLGVLRLASGQPDAFDAEDVRMVESLAEAIAVALDNAYIYREAQREIAEREHAEEALRRAKETTEADSRSRSAFLASLSHQLRTPLSAVIGYSEILREQFEYLRYTDLIPDAENIRLAGLRLLGMIQDIVDLARIEAGKMTLDLQDVNVEALVKDVVVTVQPLIEKNANLLETRCPDDLYLRTDAIKVRRILSNLLDNAARFTTQGRITLTVARETAAEGGDWVLFRVSDTGGGMTPEQVQTLSQPFTRVYAAGRREDGSVGLGLAVGQSLCELMGGEITVESELGKGSTFAVRLPDLTEERLASPAPARPQR